MTLNAIILQSSLLCYVLLFLSRLNILNTKQNDLFILMITSEIRHLNRHSMWKTLFLIYSTSCQIIRADIFQSWRIKFSRLWDLNTLWRVKITKTTFHLFHNNYKRCNVTFYLKRQINTIVNTILTNRQTQLFNVVIVQNIQLLNIFFFVMLFFLVWLEL